MKKYFLISLLLVLAFLIVHCSKDNITSPQENVQMGEVVFDETDADVYQGSLAKGSLNHVNEIRLKYFAKAIAITLESPKIRSLLKEEIGKKFDGDYDVLWEMVKDSDIPGSGKFRKVVGNRFGKGSLLSIDDIEGVPLLQISLPVNFEKWDGEEPILVAYTPLTIDDTEWEEVYAFDSEGNEHILDAKVEPDFPVIVVGINERVDPVTKNVRFGDNESSLGKAALTTGGCSYYSVININIINVFDDKEPWSKGAAEIYTKVTYGSDTKKTNFKDLNYEGSYNYTNTSWLPKEVYRRSQIISAWKIRIMEEDGPHWCDKDDLLDKEWHIDEDLTDTASDLIAPIPMLENRWRYGKKRNVDFRFIIERD